MAGSKCPKCSKLTLFNNSEGSACSQVDCGFTMVLPKANGKGGPGKKCVNCKKLTVHNSKCSTCGAKNFY
jgi:rRNA maturation protein Nop10